MAGGEGERKIPKGRVARLTHLTRMNAGLATDLVGAAGRVALGAGREAAAERFHRQAARTIGRSLGGMKGLPMKVGQMISYIDDFIPAPYRDIYRQTLAELQVKSRPMRWKEMEQVIVRDLGAPVDKLFEHFEKEPVAAASIGQVYRARLEGGREVAVKVQYPGIADAIGSDLKNLDLLRNALALVLPSVDVERTLEDITARVLEETDYGCELCSQQEFADAWASHGQILIPAPVPERSADRVLTTEFAAGASWDEMLTAASAEEKNRFGKTLYRFVFGSLYRFGMFNADPHPGNYLFAKDGQVAFLDFGCVQRFSPETIAALARVRLQLMDGLRGEKVREAVSAAFEAPEGLDEEEWSWVDEYVLAVYEPALEDRPFRFDRAYTERLADISLKGGMLFARKALRKGVREAKRPGMVFLNRIQYGFASILAALGAEANWHQIMREIDAQGPAA